MRHELAALTLLAGLAMLGCASDPPPPPDLTPNLAAEAIWQKWTNSELNHFSVTFHSDSLIECGVRNDLWKLVEVADKSGNAWTTMYQLTDKGRTILSSINLKESGRGHEILLKGPYKLEVSSISDGGQANLRNVNFRWDIDWDKAAAELKECVPRFELSGNEVAVFQLTDRWQLLSYQRYVGTEDASAPAPPAASPYPPGFTPPPSFEPDATPPAGTLDKLHQ